VVTTRVCVPLNVGLDADLPRGPAQAGPDGKSTQSVGRCRCKPACRDPVGRRGDGVRLDSGIALQDSASVPLEYERAVAAGVGIEQKRSRRRAGLEGQRRPAARAVADPRCSCDPAGRAAYALGAAGVQTAHARRAAGAIGPVARRVVGAEVRRKVHAIPLRAAARRRDGEAGAGALRVTGLEHVAGTT
jgi:hypothetical protein